MAHQCEVPGRTPDEGTDQGTNQTSSDGVRQGQVPHRIGGFDQYRAGTDLDPDSEYKVTGQTLNHHYSYGVRKFNDAQQRQDSTFPYTYASGYWNGYAAAIANIRDEIRGAVLAPEVQ